MSRRRLQERTRLPANNIVHSPFSLGRRRRRGQLRAVVDRRESRLRATEHRVVQAIPIATHGIHHGAMVRRLVPAAPEEQEARDEHGRYREEQPDLVPIHQEKVGDPHSFC